MKQFVFKTYLFVIIALAAVIVSSQLLMKFPSIFYYAGYCERWVDVYRRIQDSKDKIDSDTLYIGDSVAGQLFKYGKGSKNNYLTTNANVLSLGNYILVYNAIQRNPGIKTVIYISSPKTLGYNFERKETCNNFIKPFLCVENMKHFDKEFYEKLQSHPASLLYFIPFYKTLPVSEINFNDQTDYKEFSLSPFAVKWINKIDSLCNSHDVVFQLIPPPIAKCHKTMTDDWKIMRSQIDTLKDGLLFRKYINSFQYIDESALSDSIHFAKNYLIANREKIIAQMFKNYHCNDSTLQRQ